MTADATQPLRYSREQFIRYLDRLGVPGDCLRYARLYRQYAKQMAFQWNEEKHPRDAEGQFAEKEKAGKATEAQAAKSHLADLKQKAAQLRQSPKIVWAAVDAIENEIREIEHPAERIIVTYKGSEGEYKLETDDKGQDRWVNVDKPFARPLSVAHVSDLIKSGDAKRIGKEKSGSLPARTLDTMSDAIAMSSPQGKQSKRAQESAQKRLSEALFGEGGLQRPKPQQEDEATRLRRNAQQLRDLAARGMKPRAHIKEAERLEAEADKLDGGQPEKYALPAQFVESKHPRGKPENAGQFRPSGTAASGGGQKQPPAKPAATPDYGKYAEYVAWAKKAGIKPDPLADWHARTSAKAKLKSLYQEHVAWMTKAGLPPLSETQWNANRNAKLAQGRRVNFKGKPFDVQKKGDQWFYRAAHDTHGTWSKANKATAEALEGALGEKPKAAPPQQQAPTSQQPQKQQPRPEGVQATSANVIVNAVALGQAKFLGNGQEGMVFAIANRAVKVSMTGSKTVANEAAVGEAMRKAKVPGILKTELVNHNGRDFAIRDQLTIPDRLTPEQLHEARQSILTMHAKGFSLNDRVQVGIDQMGKVAHYDVGKAAKLPDDPAEKQRRIDADLWNLANLYRASGQEMPPLPQPAAKKEKAADKEKPAWKMVPNAPSKPPDAATTKPTVRTADEKRPAEPRIKRAEVVGDVATEYGVNPEHLDQLARDVHKEMTEFAQEREQAKAAARKLTGLTAKGIAHLENKGHDFTSSRAKGKTGGKLAKFDVYAQEIARQYPGIIGDADDPNTDFAAGLWDLLREGKTELPGRDDPSVLRTAAKRLTSMGVTNFQPTPEPQGELVPFAKRGILEKYHLWARMRKSYAMPFDEEKHPRDETGEFAEKAKTKRTKSPKPPTRSPKEIEADIDAFRREFTAPSLPAGTPNRRQLQADADKAMSEKRYSPEAVARWNSLLAELKKAETSQKLRDAHAELASNPTYRLQQGVFRSLRKLGFKRETKTGSGSAYYRLGDLTVRVSDHSVPMTAEREHNANEGGFTWALSKWSFEIDEDTSSLDAARWLVMVRRELHKRHLS